MTPEPTDADVERVAKVLQAHAHRYAIEEGHCNACDGDVPSSLDVFEHDARAAITAYDSPYVAALNELREMHRPSANKDPEYCVDCSDSMGEDTVLWPCPARQVIDRALGEGGGE